MPQNAPCALGFLSLLPALCTLGGKDLPPVFYWRIEERTMNKLKLLQRNTARELVLAAILILLLLVSIL